MKKTAPPMINVPMYPHTFSGLPAVQVESELTDLLYLVQNESVCSYLEIGVARGDTFHEIVTSMPAGSRAVAVDLPEAAWGLSSSKENLITACADLRDKGYKINTAFGNSSTVKLAYDSLDHSRFDLIMIDGDHTYDGVKADWDNYGHMGRMIAFHDIVDSMLPNAKGEVIEVPRFWNELKQNYRHVEFIAPGSTMGIGVIFRD